MASEVTIGDLTTSVPGIYSAVTFAPNQSLPATANLAVVIEDSRFEEGVLYRFNSSAEFSAFDPVSIEDPIWSDLLWQDGTAALDSLRILNIKPNTQASIDYPDANSDPAVTVNSNVWGPEGNKTYLQTTLNGTNAIDILVERGGYSEKATVVREDLGSVEYTGGVLDLAALTWDASGVTISSQRDVGPKGAGPANPLTVDTDWDHFLTDGVLTVTLDPDLGAAHLNDVTVTINGTTPGGAVLAHLLTFAFGEDTKNTGVVEFASITSVVVDSLDDAWIGTATVAGSKTFAFDGKPAKNILSDINQTPGFVVSNITPRNRLASEADYFAATNIHLGTAKLVSAMAVPMVEAFARFKLVSAERGVNGLAPSGTVNAFLAGGSESVTPADAWADGLELLETVDVNVVFPWTTDTAVGQLLEDHCLASAVQGYERRCWFATAINQTVAQGLAVTSLFSSPYVSVVDWGHRAADGITRGPFYTTLRLIGIIGRLDAGESLTNKDSGFVSGIRVYTRKEESDAINAGLVTFTIASDGSVRVAREVTSYLADNDSNRVEGSAMRSLHFYLRDMRTFFADQIGQKNTAARRVYLKKAAVDRTQQHIDVFETLVAQRGIDLIPLEQADGYDVVGEVSPVKPLNFLAFRFAVRNF